MASVTVNEELHRLQACSAPEGRIVFVGQSRTGRDSSAVQLEAAELSPPLVADGRKVLSQNEPAAICILATKTSGAYR